MSDFQDRKKAAREQRSSRTLSGRGVVENVSNRQRFAAKAELINEVLCAFATQLYEVDDRGEFLNIDNDGRLLVRVPWRKKWASDMPPALRKTERDAVRMILDVYQSSQNHSHLFEFIPPSWHIRIHRFPSLESALKWIEGAQINATLYNAIDTQRRNQRRTSQKAAQ